MRKFFGIIYNKKHDRLDDKQSADSKTRQEAKRRFKCEEDLKKGGQFVDIVKDGGNDVYKAWQENTKGMSEDEKAEEYHKFKKYVDGFGDDYPGYYSYVHSDQYDTDH